jgi:hypothetical protein
MGLLLVDVETGGNEKLTDFGTGTRWLPDARRVLFVHKDALYVTDLATRTPRLLHSVAPRSLKSVDVSADGRSLFLSVATIEADIWLLTLD